MIEPHGFAEIITVVMRSRIWCPEKVIKFIIVKIWRPDLDIQFINIMTAQYWLGATTLTGSWETGPL